MASSSNSSISCKFLKEKMLASSEVDTDSS